MLGRADLVELVDDLRWRAAVERALEGADGAADAAHQVALGRGDDQGGERRGVEAVLGADDEVGIQRPGRGDVRPDPIELIQEPRGEVERGVGGDRVEAPAQAPEGGQDGRCDRRHGARLIDRRRPGHVLSGTPGADAGAQRIHGMGVRREQPQTGLDIVRQGRAWQMRLRWPLTGPQQLGDLRVRAVLDQVADGVAAIEQSAGGAVHERDGGLPGQNALEAR
jgi:hypothetical protein